MGLVAKVVAAMERVLGQGDAGQIDLDRLLRARQQLASAVQQSHGALIEYNLALNGWRFATGAVTAPLTPSEVHPRDVHVAAGIAAGNREEPVDPSDGSKHLPQDDLPSLNGPSVIQPD